MMHWKRAKYIVETTEWMLRCNNIHECKEVLGMSPRTLRRTLERMGQTSLAMSVERAIWRARTEKIERIVR